MISSTNAAVSISDRPLRPDDVSPSDLTDAELLQTTRCLVGRSNQLLAALLAHLAELEARGIHRTRACSSLYAYCIYELRFSEDEAYRRVAASRLVRRFPALFDAIASGELHLTGLLMLGPHLTESNLVEVLARARHRTKKEIARLVRLLDPLPDVPARIEPLGPALARVVPSAPTWSAFVQSTCPVRELPPGERPRDWTEPSSESSNADGSVAHADIDIGAEGADAPREATARDPAPARLVPERYSVQFTAGREYVEFVERARALLSHSDLRLTLDELHLRAMRALVTELERQKYAVVDHARERSREDAGRHELADQKSPRRRGRYVPAAVRRAVFERDQSRCTYTDCSGQRCRETHRLELHHLIAFARGGEPTERNLTLRCRAHNALAAEQDFGKEFVEAARSSNEHEPWPKPHPFPK